MCSAGAALAQNLAAILAELKATAGPDVPIVGMTYYDVFAPLCVSQPSLLFVCSRVDALNALLADTYAGADVPVADVAGAFENDVLPNSRERVRLDMVLLGSRHAPEHDRLRRHRERVPRRAPAMSREVVMHRLAFVISTAALVAGLAAGNN